jgi:hypothetical protein
MKYIQIIIKWYCSYRGGALMARTVNGAFNEFLKNKVNLDHNQTKKAHGSKKW